MVSILILNYDVVITWKLFYVNFVFSVRCDVAFLIDELFAPVEDSSSASWDRVIVDWVVVGGNNQPHCARPLARDHGRPGKEDRFVGLDGDGNWSLGESSLHLGLGLGGDIHECGDFNLSLGLGLGAFAEDALSSKVWVITF